MASGVIPWLAHEDKVHIAGPLQLRAMKKNFEGYAAEAEGKPCVIAIDQFEEIWPEYGQELPPDTKKLVDNITTALNQFDKTLAIVLSFREEYLAKIEGHFRPLEDYWCRHAVRPLSRGDADDCIRGPAAELDIFYEDRLAAALVRALSKTADSRGPNGEEVIYVEPVELQIVCERLWNEMDEEVQDIHSADLLKACNRLDTRDQGPARRRGRRTGAHIFRTCDEGFPRWCGRRYQQYNSGHHLELQHARANLLCPPAVRERYK